MPSLSPEQVAALAYAEGLRGDRLAVAVAVAKAESGYNSDAFNGVPPDKSYGLWQINMIDPLGTPRRRTFGISTNEELFDPAVNAKAMRIVSGDGASFNAWSTYKNGSYQGNMDEARTAAASVEGKKKGDPSFWDKSWDVLKGPALSIPGVSANPFTTAKNMVELMKTVVSKVFNVTFWLRVGQFLIGVALLALGLLLLFRRSATSAAASVLKGTT